jgi:hypothetical protein
MGNVLQSLEADLSRTHPLILSEVQGSANDDSPAIVAIRTGIANIQCYDYDADEKKSDSNRRLRNPLIPVVTGPLQLTVQGQLSEGGTITVGMPTDTTGAATITRQGQQQIMLPTTLVPLINMPIFYLGQELANVQYNSAVITGASVDANRTSAETAAVSAFVTRSIDAMIGLNNVVNYALDQFDNHREEWCKGRDGGKGPPIFIGIPLT